MLRAREVHAQNALTAQEAEADHGHSRQRQRVREAPCGRFRAQAGPQGPLLAQARLALVSSARQLDNDKRLYGTSPTNQQWRAWRRGHARSCSAWLDRRHAPCALSCPPVPSATRPPSGFALAHGARPHASHAPCSRREPPLYTGGGAGLCCAAARRHNLQVGEQRTLPLADAVPSAARAREDGQLSTHSRAFLHSLRHRPSCLACHTPHHTTLMGDAPPPRHTAVSLFLRLRVRKLELELRLGGPSYKRPPGT